MRFTLLSFAWLKELGLERQGVRAKSTGQLVRWDFDNLLSVARGLVAHLLFLGMRGLAAFAPGRKYSIAFLPDRPAPWYLIWVLIHVSKGKITNNLRTADILCFFEDTTHASKDFFIPEEIPARTMNAGCKDISKAKVEQIFAEVFGYSLAIDPKKWTGKAVEKSNENGLHDGRIVQCPRASQPGKVYERLIANSDNGRTVQDYRSPTINGEIPLVFIKERPIDARFANRNSKVKLVKPQSLFSPEELRLLSRFCRRMQLDFGGLDVLRDRVDGQIYVVDVNKTDMGPPTSLSFVEQIRGVRILAAAFRKFIVLGPPVR